MNNQITLSELFKLLKGAVRELEDSRRGLNDDEFNTLYKQDEYFRKNIRLEIKDIELMARKISSTLTL